jgi:ABC-type anion transport system duplicated permease subunit
MLQKCCREEWEKNILYPANVIHLIVTSCLSSVTSSTYKQLGVLSAVSTFISIDDYGYYYDAHGNNAFPYFRVATQQLKQSVTVLAKKNKQIK